MMLDFEPACCKTYVEEFGMKSCVLMVYLEIFTAHAQKRPEYYFRFQNGPRIRNRHVPKPIYREI